MVIEFLKEHPVAIVVAVVVVEICRGNGRLMGEQIKDGLLTDPLGKVIMAVITALVIWVGQNTQGNSLKLAKLEEKVDNIITDRFTSSQAALFEQRLRSIENQLEKMDRTGR